MARIIPFPGPGVRAEIHTAIRLYAAGRQSRQQMMTFVAGRLAEYGLERLNVGNYSVRVVAPISTVLGIWPVVIIEARAVSADPHCPVCGRAEYIFYRNPRGRLRYGYRPGPMRLPVMNNKQKWNPGGLAGPGTSRQIKLRR